MQEGGPAGPPFSFERTIPGAGRRGEGLERFSISLGHIRRS